MGGIIISYEGLEQMEGKGLGCSRKRNSKEGITERSGGWW